MEPGICWHHADTSLCAPLYSLLLKPEDLGGKQRCWCQAEPAQHSMVPDATSSLPVALLSGAYSSPSVRLKLSAWCRGV